MTNYIPRYVYFIKPVGMDGPIKIGCSRVPVERLASLETWSPVPLELIVTLPGDFKLERNIHDCFADAHSHREWFKATPKLVAAISALRAGRPLAQAIDLSVRVGSINGNRKGQGGAGWSETTRRYMSLLHRMRFAVKRAKEATGRDAYLLPPDLSDLFNELRGGRMLTAEEFGRFDEVVSDPDNWFLTYEERFGRPRPHYDPPPDAADNWDDPAILTVDAAPSDWPRPKVGSPIPSQGKAA